MTVIINFTGNPVARKNGMKASDTELLVAYTKTGSLRRAAEMFGMCAQSVHERLQRLGATKPVRLFSEAEKTRLVRDYSVYRDANRLDDLAKDMGRTKQFLCRQARELRLTTYRYPRVKISVWKHMPEEVARGLFERFKRSPLGLKQFCKKYGYGDLGFASTMVAFFPDEYEPLIELKSPRQSLYRLGRQFEYRTRDDLRRHSFFVLRSPQSRGVIDLLAIAPGPTVLFVQCKRGGSLPPKEWNALFDLAAAFEAIPLLAEPKLPGVRYWRLIGRKDGSKKAQPRSEWQPDWSAA